LTLTQHPCDENLEQQEVHARLEVEPPRAWYYRISSNSRTQVILLQVDPIYGNELEIIYEGCYETKNIFIFAWFSILNVRNYCRLHDLIRWPPPNSKVDYLVRIIQRILDFLQLWIITVA
jgi:hypothetical protein